MRRSPSRRSTSCWRPRASATRSACRPTRCCSGESPLADAAGRTAAQETDRDLCQLPLPSRRLDPSPSRGGQGRVAPGRVLSPRRLHGDQPDSTQQAGGQVLQRPWHGRAVDHLANFLRTLALPQEVEQWSLTTLRDKLVKIGARIVRHGRYVVFQLAEVAVPRTLFAEILRRIDRLRPRPLLRGLRGARHRDRRRRGVHGERRSIASTARLTNLPLPRRSLGVLAPRFHAAMPCYGSSRSALWPLWEPISGDLGSD
jgi:DDE family transposase